MGTKYELLRKIRQRLRYPRAYIKSATPRIGIDSAAPNRRPRARARPLGTRMASPSGDYLAMVNAKVELVGQAEQA